MDSYRRHEIILREIVRIGGSVFQFSELKKASNLKEFNNDEMQESLYWLGEREYLDHFDSMPGEISTVRLLPRGEDLVRSGVSLFDTRRNELNRQVNINYGPSVNVQGEGNSILQNLQPDPMTEIIRVLSEEGEGERAGELQEIRERHGMKKAVSQIYEWLSQDAIPKAITSMIFPLLAQMNGA